MTHNHIFAFEGALDETDVVAESLQLTREELHELVWSKPITELSKEFGISDVALAKRCRRLRVPVPGRGYWARVAAGQAPPRAKLPKREPAFSDRHALLVPAPSPTESEMAVNDDSNGLAEGTVIDSADGEAFLAHIARLTLSPSTSIADAMPVIKLSAIRLKHPKRAELTFERGEKSGPLVPIETSESVLDRALLVGDALLRTAELLGWKFVEAAPAKSPNHERRDPAADDRFGVLLAEGEEIAFRIEEKTREEPRIPTNAELAREKREYGYRAPRRTWVPTGALRIVRLDRLRGYGEPLRRTWYDRKGKLIEAQIPEVLRGFHELALDLKAKRAKDELARREFEERERRRKELEAEQEANGALIKRLETDAGAWHRAQYLRRYIRAARRCVGDGSVRVRYRKKTIDFLNWAEAYVNQLDPLHAVDRAEEFEARSAGYFRNEQERLKESLGRLLGSDWEEAWKIGANYSPGPRLSPGEMVFSYREKSVFEVAGVGEEDD